MKSMGDLQDPKMEVLYHISGHILLGYSLKLRPYIGVIYGWYLQFRFLKWPLMKYDDFWWLMVMRAMKGSDSRARWVFSLASKAKSPITRPGGRLALSRPGWEKLGHPKGQMGWSFQTIHVSSSFIILFKPFWDDAFHFFATYLNWLVFSIKPLTSRAWGHFGFCRVQVNTSKTPDFDQAIWAFFAMAIHGELHQVSQPHKQCSKPLLVDDCGILLPNILWIIII